MVAVGMTLGDNFRPRNQFAYNFELHHLIQMWKHINLHSRDFVLLKSHAGDLIHQIAGYLLRRHMQSHVFEVSTTTDMERGKTATWAKCFPSGLKVKPLISQSR